MLTYAILFTTLIAITLFLSIFKSKMKVFVWAFELGRHTIASYLPGIAFLLLLTIFIDQSLQWNLVPDPLRLPFLKPWEHRLGILITLSMLTPFGAQVSLISVLVLVWKFLNQPLVEAHLLTSWSLCTSLLMICCLMHDKFPTHHRDFLPSFPARIRELFMVFLSLGFIATIIFTIFKHEAFHTWSYEVLRIRLSKEILISGCISISMLWLSAALNYFRAVSLLALFIPSLLITAFASGSSNILFPFLTIQICLFLSSDGLWAKSPS